MNAQQPTAASLVQTGRIIVLAMCSGVVLFGLFAVQQGMQVQEPEFGVMSIASLVVAALGLTASTAAPALIAGAARGKAIESMRRGPSEARPDQLAADLLPAYQAKTIIAAGAAEAVSFFGLAAHMMEGSPAALAVAALGLLGVLAQMPSVNRLQVWLDAQQRRIQDELKKW